MYIGPELLEPKLKFETPIQRAAHRRRKGIDNVTHTLAPKDWQNGRTVFVHLKARTQFGKLNIGEFAASWSLTTPVEHSAKIAWLGSLHQIGHDIRHAKARGPEVQILTSLAEWTCVSSRQDIRDVDPIPHTDGESVVNIVILGII
jgi:hypothetical protein